MKDGNIHVTAHYAKPLYKALEQVTRGTFKKRGLAEARIITEWHRIVGDTLANRTLPCKLSFPKGQREGGTLQLTVSSGWALEVQHLEPVILERIATYFGYKAIGKLHITQAPLPFRKKPGTAKPSPALSTEEHLLLTHATASVTHPELQAALQSLGEAVMQRNHTSPKR